MAQTLITIEFLLDQNRISSGGFLTFCKRCLIIFSRSGVAYAFRFLKQGKTLRDSGLSDIGLVNVLLSFSKFLSFWVTYHQLVPDLRNPPLLQKFQRNLSDVPPNKSLLFLPKRVFLEIFLLLFLWIVFLVSGLKQLASVVRQVSNIGYSCSAMNAGMQTSFCALLTNNWLEESFSYFVPEFAVKLAKFLKPSCFPTFRIFQPK